MINFSQEKCWMCEERTQLKCIGCGRWVCMYDSTERKKGFERAVMCFMCRAEECGSEGFSDLQNILSVNREKLDKVEEERKCLVDEVEVLGGVENKYEAQLQEIMTKHNDSLALLNSKLLLEEQSKNNAKSAAEHMYTTISTQKSKLNNLEQRLSEICSEIASYQMIISHKTLENAELSTKIFKSSQVSRETIDSNTLERILCTVCKARVLSLSTNVSLLKWSTKSSNKACASCLIS